MERHQLTMSFGKIMDSSNEYLSHKPETLYFEYNNVVQFKKAISKEGIEKALAKKKKQESIEDEFK